MSRVGYGQDGRVDVTCLRLIFLSISCVLQTDPTQVVTDRSFPVHAEYHTQHVCICLFIHILDL